MTEVSAIVVSYNSREFLRSCLNSVSDLSQVIVIDNASQDGSAEMVEKEYSWVDLVKNASNMGFGAACNQGIDLARGDLILFLNPDAVAHLGAVERLASAFENPSVVAGGGRLIFPDGRLQQSCCNELTLWALFCEQSYLEKLFSRSRIFSPYWTSGRLIEAGGVEREYEVEQVMGACLMVRKDIVSVDRFDQRYFLYCEDTDLCYRLRQRGKILYVPSAVFEHHLGASSECDRASSVILYNRGKELYFRIHHGRGAYVVAWAINRLGALIRLSFWVGASIVMPCRWQKAAMFWRVLLHRESNRGDRGLD